MDETTVRLKNVGEPESRWHSLFRRASPDDAVPSFTIVALGNRGSGKTVFLTALAHELALTSVKRRYFLRVEDNEKRVALENAYDELANGRWPSSTGSGEFPTFRFAVKVNKSTENVPEHLFDIDWIDYAGELIDDPNPGSSADDQLRSHIRDANALLCLLDGQRLRSWVDGEAEGFNYVNQDVHKLVLMAQDVSCPVHIVVTKWDRFARSGDHLFPNDAGQLEMLRAALMSVPGFSDLSSRSTIGRTKRMIPVSAVGSEFLARDGNGSVILPNAYPSGINLDVPFAAVVVDFLDGAVARLNHRDKTVLRIPWVRELPGVADTLLSGSTSTLLRTLSAENMLAAGALDLVRMLLKGSGRRKDNELPPFHKLIQDMHAQLNSFEDNHPASVMGLPAWARRD